VQVRYEHTSVRQDVLLYTQKDLAFPNCRDRSLETRTRLNVLKDKKDPSLEKIICFSKDVFLNEAVEELASIRKELQAIGVNINQQTPPLPNQRY